MYPYAVKRVLFLFLILSVSRLIESAEISFFRRDYTYINGTNAFYKIHTLPRTWKEAATTCEREGATLFYPTETDEMLLVTAYWNDTQPFLYWVFVGVTKDMFRTMEGEENSDIFERWGPGEPNNVGSNENCVVLKNKGYLNDEHCDSNYPFICKKNNASINWNYDCLIPDLDYKFSSELGSCYKLHLSRRNWTEAHAICNAEQSYLAVINSEQERNYLISFISNASTQKPKAAYSAHLGFFNRNGWITVQGVPLHESGYNRWGLQPDGGINEHCGAMGYNGQLYHSACYEEMSFVCEHQPITEHLLMNTNIYDEQNSIK